MIKYRDLLLLLMVLSPAIQAHDAKVYQYQQKQYVVFSPKDTKDLVLTLNQKNTPLKYFTTWQKNLSNCAVLQFAMNAGMYHANYQPVGLYIENNQTLKKLNVDQGHGNFFMQPNGVLAWNTQHAKIIRTEDWQKEKFEPLYATQSGPMLVVDRQVMPKLIPNSTSKHIRNGVGIKDGKLYFVLSQQRVNFYEFAQFFKEGLNVQQALYLDGSISSVYLPSLGIIKQRAPLGPMLGVVKHRPTC